MSKFPVELTDQEGIVDAINYTLSGPAGLGQDFQGFSSAAEPFDDVEPPFNAPAFLTGNFRPPFVNSDSTTATYVAPIALSVSQYIDSRTIRFTFDTPQDEPPFAIGNPISTNGITPATPWDSAGSNSATGVIVCTTEYVDVRIVGDGKTYPNGYGGTVEYNAFAGGAFVSTDCNTKVTVTGGSDRVFISAQINNILSYTATETSTITYTVMVNRRKAEPNYDPTNPDFLFGFDETVSVQNYYMQVDAGSGTLPPAEAGSWRVGVWPLETIFANVIDNPAPGFYWYLIELQIDTTSGDAVITQNHLSNRGLTVQVVKS
jgi:hypothetical protein